MTGPEEQPSPTDDTEGHRFYLMGDGEASEGEDDTEGHGPRMYVANEEAAEGEDDVSGHVQPPPDWQHLDRR